MGCYSLHFFLPLGGRLFLADFARVEFSLCRITSSLLIFSGSSMYTFGLSSRAIILCSSSLSFSATLRFSKIDGDI